MGQHRHNWEKVSESVIGTGSFQSLIGGVISDIKMKAIKEKCKICNEERTYTLSPNKNV
jgi:hypothetical protein